MQVLLGIDFGAGQGAKIGVFATPHEQLGEVLLGVVDYGGSAVQLADALIEQMERLLHKQGLSFSHAGGIGVASPGLFDADGTYRLAANLDFLNGHNLRAMLEERTGVPTGIENDANAGALAEWSVIRTEMLYWVFGGGWGGAWVSGAGEVRFPAIDWDGADSSLHYSAEPGYAVPLEILRLRELFAEVGCRYERLERLLLEDNHALTGPSGEEGFLRAEVILSGPGRCRLFHALVGGNDFYERFLDIHETREMHDPAVGGKHISKLSSMRVEAAIQTDRLFGKVLAEATRSLLQQGRRDGLREGVPICLGGKPSYALPYFGPSAQRAIGRMGFMNYLRPSVIDERGSNANLVGAVLVAERAAATSRKR